VSGTGDDYELSLASGQIESLTVVAGNSVTYNLQVANDAVFTGTVTLECPGTLPAATFCTLTPPTAVFTGPSQTIPFTIMLQTTSRTKVPGTEVPPAPRWPSGPSSPLPDPVLLAIAVLLALFVAANRHRNRRSAAILALSVLAVGAILVGCYHHSLSINGTPAGTSDLIVQGTAQNASRGLHIQLIVQ